MDFATAEVLRARNGSWALLKADNAALILSFLGTHFADQNRGPTASSVLAASLAETIAELNATDPDSPRFRRPASQYLEEWSAPERGWLRRFYPADSDEVHYDATSAFQRAYSWVSGLQARSFVGTESRLQLIIELLRQIVHGAESDPDIRLAELRRRREAIDQEIAAVESGHVAMLSPTQLRDRYQQFATTARELLADFREVEENFRGLDRATRERIASWEGNKGDVLAELVGSRSAIADSDQGRTFQAFYDFLLSERQQVELTTLIRNVESIGDIESDERLRTIHRDWAVAAERTQQTVRLISEQLRRFLDDRVWLESRRVIDLIRSIEAIAIKVRDDPPRDGIELDGPGIDITLPADRPLYHARPVAAVQSTIDDTAIGDLDAASLFEQAFVDQTELLSNIRAVVPRGASAQLGDILQQYPTSQGLAELVAYLALEDDDIEVVMDESETAVLEIDDADSTRRVRMPRTEVRRR